MKISFIQPAYADYRKELFKKLSSTYDIVFHYLKRARPYLDSLMPSNHNYIEYEIEGGKIEQMSGFSRFFRNIVSSESDIIIHPIAGSTPSLIGNFVSKLRDKKSIVWVIKWQKSSKDLILNLKARLDMKYSDAIIVSSTKSYHYCRKFGIPKEKIFTANQCSLDFSRFQARSLEEELGTENKVIILYVGRIIKMKGLDILIRGIDKLRREDVFLLIVGDGAFRPSCEELVKDLKIEEKVKFVGTIYDKNKLASLYKTADIYVLPTCLRENYDTWGMGINEAMSMSTPVIATDATGVEEDLIRNGINGFVVKNCDVNALTEALRPLVEDKKLREKMGKNGREIFEKFNDFKKMFKGFKKAIEYVINQ